MREERGKDVRSGANGVERDIALRSARRPGVAGDERDVEHSKQVRDVREEDRFGEVEPRANPDRPYPINTRRYGRREEIWEMGDGGWEKEEGAHLRPYPNA